MPHEKLRLKIRLRFAFFTASVIATASSNLGNPGFADGQTRLDRLQPPNAMDLLIKMQSDRFSERQWAMLQIFEFPESALPLLQECIESGDGDFQYRALRILEQIAMGSDASSDLAFNTLRNISLSDDVLLSRKAQSKSYEVLLYRQYVSAKKLERLNAHIVYASNITDQKFPMADRLTINEDWRGDSVDLQQISSLFGLSSLELSHQQVDDQLLLGVDSIYALSRIKLKRCSITDKTVETLSRLSALRELEIYYCPIGLDCFESLKKFKRLTSIRLIGTKIEPVCADLLEQRLNAVVDIRRGAFLGIRYSPTESICRLTSIVPGSGAEKAGFQVGDEIIEFNQHAIDEHADLTRHLREYNPGEKATVGIKRGSSVIEFSVDMGEWE